ncbi:glutamate racemase [Pendulispora brunnea]|uniref:Glutamate racemase n=1 Tax=Pendulispora brunnea TaxID=2905690 RepID=A0ABZ2KKP8_9BACT
MRAGNEAPLGVFDSGLGGLTVVRALRAVLPHEDIVYLGDTARVPYGTRGAATVVKYAGACARQLVSHKVKTIVIACNTVSAVAPEQLRIDLDLPVLGVIEPGARAAVAATKTGRVGILATPGTIFSQAYTRAVTTLSTRTEVFGQAAPLLVPLAEEGWVEGEVPRLAVRRYLEPLARAGVDAIVLGCTHYPLFFSIIEEEAHAMMGPEVRVIDSATTVAAETRSFLASRSLLAPPRERAGSMRLFATDVPRSFSEMARRFLGDENIPEAEQIDL